MLSQLEGNLSFKKAHVYCMSLRFYKNKGERWFFASLYSNVGRGVLICFFDCFSVDVLRYAGI